MREPETVSLGPDSSVYFRLLAGSHELISIADRAGNLVYANPIHETFLGYPSEELLGQAVLDLVHPDDRAAATMALLDAVRDQGEGGAVPVRLRRRDGSWLQVSADGSFVREGDEAWILFVSRVMPGGPDDEQREVARLSAILHAQQATTPDGVLVTTPEGDTLSFNQNYLHIWGLSAEEVQLPYDSRMRAIARRLREPAGVIARIDALYEHPADSMELDLELLDGRVIETHTAPFQTGNEIHGRVWFFRDISERVYAARQLQENEERYRRLVELSPNAIAVHSGGIVRYVNKVAVDLIAASADDLLGRNVFDFVHPDDRLAVMQASVERDFSTPRFVQARLLNAAGDVVYVEMGSSATSFDGEPATQTVMRDVSDRMHAERALRESEERYRALVETAPDAVFMHDGNAITYANPAAVAMLGFSDPSQLIGRHPWDVVRGIPRETFEERTARVLAGETMRAFEQRFFTYLGTQVHVEIALAPATVLGKPMVQVIMRDVTDRVRAENERLALERKLLETQKLESLGLLAGGIAHDFNNLLVAIMGNAGLAMLEAESGSNIENYLREIEAASQRAADLARQMLAYSGRGKFVVEHLDLSAAVRDIATLLAISLPRKATLHYDLADDLPPVEADATQLRQIIMNLVINAAEALGDEPGTIGLETSTRSLTAEDISAISGSEAQPGVFACLRVSDTGCGMDALTASRIFDPFFTTKFTGRGLGLAAVLGIVRGHKGAIRVTSERGKGTAFELFLPVTPNPEPRGSAPAAPARAEFKGRVLLVDDEPHVRKVAATMLATLGFEVVKANGGEEALQLAGERPDDLALIVADMTMPGMDGCELVTSLREAGATAPAVIMSGYSANAEAACLQEETAYFLSKPFTLAEMELTVRTAITALSRH